MSCELTARPLRVRGFGPLPPPDGGTTVLYDLWCTDLRESYPNARLTALPSGLSGISRLVGEVRLICDLVVAPMGNDVVVLHASYWRGMCLGALLALTGRLLRTPTILRFFGSAHDLVHEQVAARGRFARILHDLICRAAFSNTRVLVETEILRNWCERKFPNAAVEQQPNVRRTHPREVRYCTSSGSRSSLPLVLFVGTVCRAKGAILIAQMRAKWPHDQYRLAFVGPVTESGITEAFSGLPHVDFLGPMEERAVREVMTEASVLILPTMYQGEGHPGVIIEAFSVGLPVVASRWRAVPELIQHEDTGLLFEVGDLIGMRESILRVINDVGLAASLSRRAAIAASRYDAYDWHRNYWPALLSDVAGGLG